MDGVILLQDAIQHPGELLHEVQVRTWEREVQWSSHFFAIDTLEDEVDHHGNVPLEQLIEGRDKRLKLILLADPLTHPLLEVGLIS